MEGSAFYTPAEIAQNTIKTGQKKARLDPLKQLILGVLAGAFVAFAAEGSNMAAFNLWAGSDTYGLGKALAGALFTSGLMMVIIAGGELFTGNNLIIMAVLEKKVSVKDMMRNWCLVYLGNFIGALLIAWLIQLSGLLGAGHGELGAITLKIAGQKTSLSFSSAFVRGILCNWLVCLAVWMAYAAKDISGKVWAIFFPIWLFVTSGFEHCVANMYYIPAGIMAKANPVYVSKASELGLSPDQLSSLTWGNFIGQNLLPVTLGNIVGGCVFVGLAYWWLYARKSHKA